MNGTGPAARGAGGQASGPVRDAGGVVGAPNAPAGRAPRGGEAPARPAPPTTLLWSELADAIWLAGRIRACAIGAGDPVTLPQPGRAGGLDAFGPPPAGIDPATGAQVDDRRPGGTRRQRGTTVAPGQARSGATRLADGAAGSTSPPGRTPAPSRALSGSLRPLRRFTRSAHDRELHEEATAERAAADGLWLPVFEQAQEYRWDLALVVDDHTSMIFWRETVAAFATAIEQSGVFRNILRRRLVTGTDSPNSVVLLSGRGGPASSPAEIADPSGRRLILVLTDGIGRAWRSRAVESVLHRWGQQQPVALVHLLPQQLWHRAGIVASRGRVRPDGAGPGNRLLLAAPPSRAGWDAPVPAEDPRPVPLPAGREHAIPVPVLELEPASLGHWAGLVSGARSGWTDLATTLAWRTPEAGEEPATPAGSGAYSKVNAFRAAASPQALRLATHLAAAPLNVGVIQAIRHRLLPGTRPWHLSELLLANLLRPTVGRELAGDDTLVTFDFDRGIREELLARGRRAETAGVMRLVQTVLGARVSAVRYSARALDEPADETFATVTEQSRPYLVAELAALRAMSGRHLPRARALAHALDDQPGDSGTGAPGLAHRRHDQVFTDSNDVTPERDVSKIRTQLTEGANVSVALVPDQTAATASRLRGALPKGHGQLPVRNAYFTGREDLLQQLHARLMRGPTAVLPDALHGRGGVGKSQLVIEYIYRHLADYDLIWWIPAERRAQIDAALVELAQSLGLDAGTEANTAVPAVLRELAAGRPTDRWLLVFDNADSPEDVKRYFPTGPGGPPTSVGRVLVTSRNGAWAQEGAPLAVDVFEREESRHLLQRRSPGLDARDADRLAAALGDLPLAVEQAATWRAVTGMPADEYLEQLEREQAELAEQFPDLRHELPVAAAWRIALDRLEQTNKGALQLLGVCSFFAPEQIPWGLFANVRSTTIIPELDSALRDRTKLRRAMHQIDRFGLARIDLERETLQLHRLVRDVVRSRLTEEEQSVLRHGAHLVLASSDPNDWADPAHWPRYGELYAHVVDSRAYDCDEAWVRQLVVNEAKYLWKWGAHAASRDLTQRTYETWRAKYGEEDLETTLTISKWLGWILFVVGRFQDCAEVNSRRYEVLRRIRGEDDEDTLKALGDVAADARVRGDFATSADLSRQVHERLRAAYGDDDPSVLVAAHNRGVSLRLVGDFRQALAVDESTVHHLTRSLGAEDDSILATRISINIDRWELGDYTEARISQEEIVAAYRRVLRDENNPLLLFAVRYLAVALRKAGEMERARALSEDAHRRYVDRYGEDYPETLNTALNLSIDRRQTADLNGALLLGQNTLNRYRRILGQTHPHALAAAANLAVILRRLGEVEQAYSLDRATLDSFRERVGENHPLTLLCATNLASDAFARGEFEEAEERDRDTVARSTAVHGENHPATLMCAANLALDLRAAGRTGEATRRHGAVVAQLTRTLGSTHPVTRLVTEWQRADCDVDPMPL